MNNIPQPSFFNITELVRLVAQHLSQHEIVQCVQVSKQFALQFESMLWEHLDFTKKTPSAEASYRNLIHIRSIKLGAFVFIKNAKSLTHGLQCPTEDSNATESTSKRDLATIPAPPITIFKLPIPSLSLCTNLRRIDAGDRHGISRANIFLLLLHNPGLQSIVLPAFILESERLNVQQFLEVIPNLTNLEDMTLQGKHYTASVESDLSFLRTCLKLPRLSRLKMDYHTNWTKSGQQAFTMQIPQILDEALAERRMATVDGVVEHKIREFVLPHIFYGYSISLVSAILQSELLALESFTIPQIDEHDFQGSLDVLGNAVRQHCTRVQHLVIPDRFRKADYNNVDRTVIRECSGGLRSIQGSRFSRLSCWPSAIGTLWTAIKHHCKVLEEIELRDCMGFTSMDIQEALVSCTKLRRFWIEPDFRSIVFLDVDDVAQGDDWGCLGMKELCLKLHRDEPQPEGVTTGNEEDTKVSARSQRLYEQIGRLVELEVLALNISKDVFDDQFTIIDKFSWDLTLSRGYLQKLSGLKKLHELKFMGDFYSKMSQADVEFIDAEWPQLEQIEFGNVHSKISETPPWKWLKERRPGLRYVRT